MTAQEIGVGKMKYYLSGPITGISDYEKQFAKAEKTLEAQGLNVVNPVNISRELEREKNAKRGSLPYDVYMRADISALITCDAIIMLHGWNNSKGALFELAIAKVLNLEIYFYNSRTKKLKKNASCFNGIGTF